MRRFIAIVLLLGLGACGTHPETTAGLGRDMPLKPMEDNLAGNTLVYRAPGVDASHYRGLYIAPTIVYTGETDWGGTDAATRRRIADRLTSEFKRALRDKGRLVLDRPTANSATLQRTLGGVTSTHGVAANALKLSPVGFGMTVVKSAAGLPAAFTGSITVAGEIKESKTGKLLGGFVSRESPTALDPRTLRGTEQTAMLAATKSAEDFAAGIVRAQQQGN